MARRCIRTRSQVAKNLVVVVVVVVVVGEQKCIVDAENGSRRTWQRKKMAAQENGRALCCGGSSEVSMKTMIPGTAAFHFYFYFSSANCGSWNRHGANIPRGFDHHVCDHSEGPILVCQSHSVMMEIHGFLHETKELLTETVHMTMCCKR